MAPALHDGNGPHRMMLPLPVYHAGALLAGLLPNVDRGVATVLITDPRNLDTYVEVLATQAFTMICGINTLYAGLVRHPRIGEVDFSRCRCAIAGAAATQPAVAERFRAVAGVPLREVYGMTELAGAATIGPLDERAVEGICGLPLPLVELSVRDLADREVATGAEGEVCIRGPQVMAGYWQRPDETRRVMTPDGFLRTGDIGRLDAHGYLHVVDRKKDMILVSGFNVFPNEVEAVLAEHPKVREAAVVAVDDAHSGEVPVAFVVRADPTLGAEELRQHCAARLTAYKRPRHFEFRDALPKTPVGKILRRALRDEAHRASGPGAVS
jgi:long-chain acyl-CoA synthetase